MLRACLPYNHTHVISVINTDNYQAPIKVPTWNGFITCNLGLWDTAGLFSDSRMSVMIIPNLFSTLICLVLQVKRSTID